MNSVRSYSSRTPRFLKTLSETSKPPLTKPKVVSKPFGLESPVLLLNTDSSITKGLFSVEAKELRQRQLDHDIKHSPFFESKSFTNTNGKIFTPPVSYFKDEKSKYFPNFKAPALDGNNKELYSLFSNKLSLVRIFSTISGEQCTESYFKNNDGNTNYLTTDYQQFQQSYSPIQIIDLNIPQNWAKRWAVNFATGNIKKSMPQERHQGYFILNEKLFPFDIKQQLLCDNSCSGYIYLIDHNGKIRWATSGYSNPSELELMMKCIKGVAKEIK